MAGLELQHKGGEKAKLSPEEQKLEVNWAKLSPQQRINNIKGENGGSWYDVPQRVKLEVSHARSQGMEQEFLNKESIKANQEITKNAGNKLKAHAGKTRDNDDKRFSQYIRHKDVKDTEAQIGN